MENDVFETSFPRISSEEGEGVIEENFDALSLSDGAAFQSMSLSQLKASKVHTAETITSIQKEISEMAFQNYRTYADVGRIAEHCKKMFVEMNQFMTDIQQEFPALVEESRSLKGCGEKINTEYQMLESVSSTNSKIWQLLKLPMLMDKFIRSGQFEKAFALTNFAVNLQQSRIVQNPMVKNIVDKLIEARHGLLDELFSRFAGPIDLAKSVQVITSIRKIPYTSNTQLRISLLQYRDRYLDKRVLSIMSESDFLLRVVEVFRDVMYDTMVLYLAVFPHESTEESETVGIRKYSLDGPESTEAEEPRWERWTGGIKNHLLHIWAFRNVEHLFSHVRGAIDQRSVLNNDPELVVKDIDIEAVIGKLMSFGYSLGRMGFDFRPWVAEFCIEIVTRFFQRKVDAAVKGLTSLKRLDLLDESVFGDLLSSKNEQIENLTEALSAPLELCTWDDICVFGNGIIAALNDSRHALYVPHINPLFDVLKTAFQHIFQWLDTFLLSSVAPTAAHKKERALTPTTGAWGENSSEGMKKVPSLSAFPQHSSSSPSPQHLQPQQVPASLVARASKLLLSVFLPHMSKMFLSCFPYEQCVKPRFRSDEFSVHEYETTYGFVSPDLFRLCRREEFFVRIYEEVLEANKAKPAPYEKVTEIEANQDQIKILIDEENGGSEKTNVDKEQDAQCSPVTRINKSQSEPPMALDHSVSPSPTIVEEVKDEQHIEQPLTGQLLVE